MRITATEEYGLRCLITLARLSGDGPVTIRQIADTEQLSFEYVTKLLRPLKKSHLVKTIRGTKGGILLDRKPEKISLREILLALDTDIFDKEYCYSHIGQQNGKCINIAHCTVRPIWHMVSIQFMKIMSRFSLADLLTDRKTINAKLSETFAGFNQHT